MLFSIGQNLILNYIAQCSYSVIPHPGLLSTESYWGISGVQAFQWEMIFDWFTEHSNFSLQTVIQKASSSKLCISLEMLYKPTQMLQDIKSWHKTRHKHKSAVHKHL